jgi:hypothetical protein
MITRGYYIGEIIDELSSICSQIKFRSKLNLLDFNIYVENFFRDILNIIENANFLNLNELVSNFAGLDLYDSQNNIGIQISSTNSIKKIRDTLEKLGSNTDPTISNCQKAIILIIGDKQKKYDFSTSESDSIKPYISKYNFTENDIWDINTLSKKVIDLSVEDLKSLYELFKKEAVRIKIELEIPNEEGIYPTDLQDYIEKPPQIVFNGLKSFYEFRELHGFYGLYDTESENEEEFQKLVNKLSHLPRITRQFFAYFLENSERESNIYNCKIYFPRERLKKLCSLPDIDSDIWLLLKYKLILHEIEDLNDGYDLPSLKSEIYLIYDDSFYENILRYIEHKGLNIRKIIIELDFSDFN